MRLSFFSLSAKSVRRCTASGESLELSTGNFPNWSNRAYFVEEFALRQLAGGRGAIKCVLGRLVELAQMGFVLIYLALGGLCFGVHGRDLLVHIILGRAAAKTEGAGGYGSKWLVS